MVRRVAYEDMFTGPDMVIGRMARLHDRVGEGRAPSSALEEGSEI